MPYTPTTWTDGATPLSASNMNNLETQYNEAVTDLTDGSTPYQVVPIAGLTGATAATRYVGGTAGGAPATGTFAVGDFVVDQTGLVWICTVAGSPGAWTSVNKSGSQVFTANGTFIVPAGVSRVFAQCWGGGGGGGQSGSYFSVSGGTGGNYAEGWIEVSAGQNIAVTVGSGGTGAPYSSDTTSGNPSNTYGTNGGNSGFGNYVVSNGGLGGGYGLQSATGVTELGTYIVDVSTSSTINGTSGATAVGGAGGTGYGSGTTTNGGSGQVPGGGGGASYGGSGGNGARGEVRVYY